MVRQIPVAVAVLASFAPAPTAAGGLPAEPVEIGTAPQFFVDDYMVDNRFAIKYKHNEVVRRFHPPVKHEANPLLVDDGSYSNVIFDDQLRRFRMWYQVFDRSGKSEGESTRYAIAYAESPDGIHWERPNLGLYQWKGTRENNVVWRGTKEARASGMQLLLAVPEDQRRGRRFLMSYRVGGSGRETDGIRLILSDDGIHWEEPPDGRIKHIHSDTLNSIVFDPVRSEYVMFCRAKHIYRAFGSEMIDTGASRRIARMASPVLWTEWPGMPQNVLIPDELDAEEDYNFFYGMPTHYHAGIYWGFLWVFRMNDPIHTELVTSRDGIHWDRLPKRSALIPLGEEGAWDDGMTFGGPHWVEVGDQWWFYYGGFDGGHDSTTRAWGAGLAVARKEGLISLHGPANGGGVVVTRTIVWPDGDLVLNVEAPDGTVKVRLSDSLRKVLPGFDYGDCQAFAGDSTGHVVRWKNRSIDELAGEVIRLEIFLESADLYTFRATGRK